MCPSLRSQKQAQPCSPGDAGKARTFTENPVGQASHRVPQHLQWAPECPSSGIQGSHVTGAPFTCVHSSIHPKDMN